MAYTQITVLLSLAIQEAGVTIFQEFGQSGQVHGIERN
jgi:hypothetical protein